MHKVASNEAPPELQATAQGLFAGVYQGLAPSMSGFIGFLIIKSDVPAIAGESEDSALARRKALLATRTGFFDDNNGMFRVSAMYHLVSSCLCIGLRYSHCSFSY